MRIGFFGTPDIASFCLKNLCGRHQVLFAVTNVDKPQGRSGKPVPSPVKACAEDECVDIIQPASLKDPDFENILRSYEADIFVVVAYGHIIPEKIFSMPKHGTINLHPSLLPKYRGAAPVQWALINGEKETGVTIQKIEMELDAGDILMQEKALIGEDITAGELYEKLIPKGYELLLKTLDGIEDGTISPMKQDHSAATVCKKITRDTAHIDWKWTCGKIHNLVRGLNPKPIAWSTFRQKEIKILKTRLFSEDSGIKLSPGEIAKFQKKRLLAGTADGVIEILEIQPETKKPMDALSFLNGARLEEKESFV